MQQNLAKILLILSCLMSPAFVSATDFQMPASIAPTDENNSTNKTSLVSKGTYKLLAKVQTDIDNNQLDTAFERLNDIIIRVKDNAYESAVVLKTAGYIYVTRDQIPNAVELFRYALRLNALAKENQQKLRYDIAQLLMGEQQYQDAILYLIDWLNKAQESDVSPANYIRIGSAYLQIEQFSAASIYFEKAIAQAIKQNKKPSEYPHQLLLASYMEDDKFPEAITVLKQLVSQFKHKKSYHMQLFGLYDETNQTSKALATLEIAYKQGLLDDTAEYTALAYRMINAGYPHKAAQILQQGLDDFIIWITPENLTLLARAHIDAQEPLKAITVLNKAANTASNSTPAQMLSQLYIEQLDWKNAANALVLAIEKADQAQSNALKTTLAYTLFEQGEIEQAKLIFNGLEELTDLSDALTKRVQDWNQYLQTL